jgi:hypothetical protein
VFASDIPSKSISPCGFGGGGGGGVLLSEVSSKSMTRAGVCTICVRGCTNVVICGGPLSKNSTF